MSWRKLSLMILALIVSGVARGASPFPVPLVASGPAGSLVSKGQESGTTGSP